jgi:hypothetical protein
MRGNLRKGEVPQVLGDDGAGSTTTAGRRATLRPRDDQSMPPWCRGFDSRALVNFAWTPDRGLSSVAWYRVCTELSLFRQRSTRLDRPVCVLSLHA